MEAKEKAKELLDRVLKQKVKVTIKQSNGTYKEYEKYMSLDSAKRICIDCIDEINKELSYEFLYDDKRRVYYRKVKNEIEKS